MQRPLAEQHGTIGANGNEGCAVPDRPLASRQAIRQRPGETVSITPAVGSQRAKAASRPARRADRGAEIHHRLGVVAGALGRHQAGLAEDLPRRAPKAEKPTRRGLAFVLSRKDGAILLRKRPAKGLLGGMDEVPSSPWREGKLSPENAMSERSSQLSGTSKRTSGLS